MKAAGEGGVAMPATDAETDGKRERTTVLIGMNSPEGRNRHMRDSPTDNVEVLIVRYPMVVEKRHDPDSEACEPITVHDEAGLWEWARQEFDHYDIRSL